MADRLVVLTEYTDRLVLDSEDGECRVTIWPTGSLAVSGRPLTPREADQVVAARERELRS